MFTECFDLLGFIECVSGYIGVNCFLKCPYPTYERKCQAICSETLCDISGGCSTLTPGNVQFFVILILDTVSQKRRKFYVVRRCKCDVISTWHFFLEFHESVLKSYIVYYVITIRHFKVYV